MLHEQRSWTDPKFKEVSYGSLSTPTAIYYTSQIMRIEFSRRLFAVDTLVFFLCAGIPYIRNSSGENNFKKNIVDAK